MNATLPRSDAAPPAPLIYVVEDDAAIAKLVVAALHEFGFATEAFRNGATVLRRLQTERPDLCIVDLGLPDMDGIELRAANQRGVEQRRADPHRPRPHGRSRDGPRTRRRRLHGQALRAARAGGARAQHPAPAQRWRRGRWRRPDSTAATPASWAGRLDCAANILRAADGSEHLLGTAETQVLRAFVERPFQILTREQLIGQRDLSPLDRSIDVRISRLRRKLESDPQNPKIIKTVYGAGYMFSAAVTWS